ncbi:MAG: hypothetical protein L0177_07880 [Chloroflexi bacterium]|nr:hypothetical protein [Chloroflexota bacterium]
MEDRYVFLIHWNAREADEYASALREQGYEVEVEARSGERAFESIRTDTPDAVAVFLSRQPSQGRDTARALRRLRRMQGVPLIFVDGKEEAIVRAMAEFEGATFTKASELSQALEALLVPRPPGLFSRLKKRWS